MNEYTVTVEHNGQADTFRFASERAAVAQIEAAERADNLTLVDYSDNINYGAYRY